MTEQYAVMPMTDYTSIADAVRAKNPTAPSAIKSGEVAPLIRGISGGSEELDPMTYDGHRGAAMPGEDTSLGSVFTKYPYWDNTQFSKMLALDSKKYNILVAGVVYGTGLVAVNRVPSVTTAPNHFNNLSTGLKAPIPFMSFYYILPADADYLNSSSVAPVVNGGQAAVYYAVVPVPTTYTVVRSSYTVSAGTTGWTGRKPVVGIYKKRWACRILAGVVRQTRMGDVNRAFTATYPDGNQIMSSENSTNYIDESFRLGPHRSDDVLNPNGDISYSYAIYDDNSAILPYMSCALAPDEDFPWNISVDVSSENAIHEMVIVGVE